MISSSFHRTIGTALPAVVVFLCLALAARAQDRIVLTNGSMISGEILGVADGQVSVSSHASNGGLVQIQYALGSIKSVVMAEPADVSQAQNAPPATVISVLAPELKKFAGLPAEWVVTGMAQLAQAYAATGQPALATDIYNQITTLYPTGPYRAQAVAGKAQLSLQQGHTAEALAAVQPLIDLANKNIAPSPADGAIYASAFLVYGQAMQAQKKLPQALEAYLTVTTMFYQNPTLTAQAGTLAQKLRDQNPGIGVE
jgi:tetratricopeptide (TPR) repeat protein